LNRAALIPAACLLDRIAGDPEWLPHPVRLIGLAASRGEAIIRRPHQSPTFELCSGTALTLAIVAAMYSLTRQILRTASRRPVIGSSIELLLAWTCIAARNLEQEAVGVTDALAAHDLPLARRRLARIVGRDTATLDEPEICRALIETLAESASDGILAPLFYMALGGVPLAMAYKAVNTLDSMIGHADTRFLYFGKFAARLDDLANFIPARLTAAAIACIAPHPPLALRIWHRDGYKHKSPNAGQPEAAISGALQVRLGGSNTYAGEVIPAPILGAEFPSPTLAHAIRATRMVSLVTWLGVAVASAILLTRARSRRA
jgi:adenosylcobinamide-phosphate synthase